MQFRLPPTLPAAFLVVWAISWIFSFLYVSVPAVFWFAYFVLPISAFIVPLCFAHISCQIFGLSQETGSKHQHSIGLSLISAIIGVASYVLTISVVGTFLQIPWRMGKFEEGALSLGRSAAEAFGLAAVIVTLSAIALLRIAPPNSRYTKYAAGSIGMVGAASIVYLLLGLSPFVEWRA